MLYKIALENVNADLYIEKRYQNIFCIPHIHSHSEIVFVLNGDLGIIINNRVYHLKEGDMAIVMPYEIHEYKTYGKSDMFIMEFPVNAVSEFNREFSDKSFNTPIAKMSENFKAILYDFMKMPDKSKFLRKSIIYYAISEFMKCGNVCDKNISLYDTATKALHYITENYNDDINLTKISKNLGVTPVHLSRVFSKGMGRCFTETVNIVRLGVATEFLCNTDMNIGEIAYECGFGSIRNFNRVFEKYYKCTPREFRNS